MPVGSRSMPGPINQTDGTLSFTIANRLSRFAHAQSTFSFGRQTMRLCIAQHSEHMQQGLRCMSYKSSVYL